MGQYIVGDHIIGHVNDKLILRKYRTYKISDLLVTRFLNRFISKNHILFQIPKLTCSKLSLKKIWWINRIIYSLKNEFIFRPAETNTQKSNLRNGFQIWLYHLIVCRNSGIWSDRIIHINMINMKPLERKAIAKKWEIKKPEGHDGFCPLLRIYRPRTSMKKKDELNNLPAKVRRFKWVRDPISDQWIHVERIGEEARAA